MTLRRMCELFLLLGMFFGNVAAGAEVPRLVSLHMTSRTTGWAVSGTAAGYYVLRTRDGGRRWSNVSPPGFSQTAPNDWDHDINRDSVGSDFQDTCTAWLAVVSGQYGHNAMNVYHTSDGGRRWVQTRFATTKVGDRSYIQFLDQRHGFILSVSGPAGGHMDKRVYRTADGGHIWRLMSDISGDKHGYWMFYPSGMTFRSPNEGWITGSYRGEPPVPFLHTRDGGRTWGVEELSIPSRLADGSGDTEPAMFFGEGRHQGVFTARIEGNVAFRTRDGGKTWRCRRLPLALRGGVSTCFMDARNGWAIDGDARLLYGTRDGGRTWHRLTSHLRRLWVPGIVNYQSSRLDFITARVGWALIVCQRDVSLPPATNRPSVTELRRTLDGGRHWRTISIKQEQPH